jgi:hypothetical protein
LHIKLRGTFLNNESNISHILCDCFLVSTISLFLFSVKILIRLYYHFLTYICYVSTYLNFNIYRTIDPYIRYSMFFWEILTINSSCCQYFVIARLIESTLLSENLFYGCYHTLFNLHSTKSFPTILSLKRDLFVNIKCWLHLKYSWKNLNVISSIWKLQYIVEIPWA